MTIGSDLREAREQRGLTLADISTRTKIRVQVLRAIESDDFDHVPGGVITRGFLKLYAREVGLDPDEIARRFNALHGPAIDPLVAPAGGESILGNRRGPADGGARSRLPAALVIAAIVAIGSYVAWSRTRPTTQPAPAKVDNPPPAEATRPDATTGSPAAAGAVTPASTTGTLAEAKPTREDLLHVEVRATDASWLTATADGQQVAYRTLNAGDEVSLSVKTLGVLRIGIPANVTVTINGAEVKPFGIPGNPATLRITPDNYRTLLP